LLLGKRIEKQHLDNVRRKDPLRGAETTEIFVRLGNYSASYFEGSAGCLERLEPDIRKRICPVLRGGGDSNVAPLPDSTEKAAPAKFEAECSTVVLTDQLLSMCQESILSASHYPGAAKSSIIRASFL
jgi:hypothetical protein